MNMDQSIEDVYPLSPMQQGMLFSSLYAPDSGVYFTQVVCSLRGALNLPALDAAWAQVLERHAILRTAFIWEGMDEPLQVVQRQVKLPMDQHNWTGIRESEFTQRLRVFLEEDRRRGFNFSNAPLMRFILIRTGEDSYQFIWCYHHLLIDGWCHVILLREVFAYYEALCQGQPLELRQVRPYRDYIAWLQQQDHSAAEAYWREYLRGFTTPTPLGIDRPRHVQTEQPIYVHQEQLLGQELAEAVQQMGRRYRLTTNTIVQSAWALLLARYSRQQEVVYGVTVSGRPGELNGVEQMVGLFINTLPVRVRIDEQEEVKEWLRRQQAEQVEMRQYEYSALVEVQGWSEVEPGRPLFESVFAFDNYPVGSFSRQRLGSIEVGEAQQIEGEDGPLTITFSLNTDLAVIISYDSSRFEEAVINRMIGHLRTLLEAMTADPSTRLSQLPLLTEAERNQLLEEFNQTAKEFPHHQCLHHLFEAQAERTPDAPALCHDKTEWSYRELNERANQVAHYLRSLGVGPEVPVGLLLTRSMEMVAALLGVLKAGGAYVPIDPEYPRERLSFMLKDAAVNVLLTESQFESVLAEQVDVNIVELEAAKHEIKQQSVENPPRSAKAQHLAYIIYTSGSTGQPKGAMVTHDALVNYAQAMAHRLPLQASDRILQFASLGFDVMVEELFPTWVSGASVVLPTVSAQELAGDLSRFIAQDQITGLELPTAGWHAWVQQLSAVSKAGPPECLRFVIVGGERASMEDVRAWHQWDAELIHVYGVTEATVTTTVHRGTLVDSQEYPLGGPVANAEVYVLDERLGLVPVGVAGELYIGGVALGRGYLRRPGLTAERFVPHPFSKEKGMRLYRTGDLVRWREDGELEYVGRIDEQVKVRGYRVELGEIEAVLRDHASVNEALVVVHEDHNEKELVAYVVPRSAHPSTNGDNRIETIELWPSHGEYPIYDEMLYYAMVRDERRNSLYRAALNRLVKDKTVVEIGTGSEALLSKYCVQAGAEKVYALEILEESYQKARANIERAGMQDRISLIKGDALEVELPEQAEACVSELIGTIGSSEGAVQILNQARRLLKPGGIMIPQRCVTLLSAAMLPEEIVTHPQLSELGAYYAEKVFDEVGRRFDLRVCIKNFPRTHLLSSRGVFEELDFRSHMETEQRHEVTLKIEQHGTFDGFLLWINLYVEAEGERIDSLEDECSWLPMYVPAFDTGVEVEAGDVIEVECGSQLSDDGVHPDYWIRGRLRRASGEEIKIDCELPHHENGRERRSFYRALYDEPNKFVERHSPVKPEEPLMGGVLREFVQQRLPAYMVPSRYVVLERFPLNAHGKVERRALPAPERVRAETGVEYVAPKTPLEETVASIWAEVLRVDRVGVKDSFFALGGHSLLAMQVTSRVREALELDVPLRALFEHRTLESYALAILQNQIEDGDDADLSELLRELDGLSDEHVRVLLSDKP